MRRVKTCLLLLCAVLCVALGAAMPELTSRMQNTRISQFQKKLELNPVELTLRQEDVSQAIQLLSQDYIESIWKGKTRLTEEDAWSEALTAVEAMEFYGLFPMGESEFLKKVGGSGEPHLLVAEDGSSALVWDCTWGFDSETFFSVDDTTGKVVRISLFKDLTDIMYEEDYALLECWALFLQDYYDIRLADVREGCEPAGGGPGPLYQLRFTAADGTELTFSLQLMENYFLLNF